LADIIITATLIVKLRKAIGKGFGKIDSVIGKLIKTTLQTGLLTTIFAVVDLILYLSSTTTIDMVFNFPLANLYMISLLSTLNARVALRNGKLTYTGACIACAEGGTNTNQGPISSSLYMERGLPRPVTLSTKVIDNEDRPEVTSASSDEEKEPF
jgi:hypothetical protein